MKTPWDNSNSQYGLLGVWAGAEAGVEVPTKYWKAVQQHWLSCELKTGEWFYSPSPGKQTPTLQMTCAGIASLLITHDYLDAPALGTRLARTPYSPGLSAGLRWLEDDDNVINIMTEDMWYVGYNLYGIERCARPAGTSISAPTTGSPSCRPRSCRTSFPAVPGAAAPTVNTR
jgi:hypothetical protein